MRTRIGRAGVDVLHRLGGVVKRSLQGLPGLDRGLVVGISGGPDSVALLRLILEIRSGDCPFPVVLAHLDHQLRGAESTADAAFVAELFARLCASGVRQLRHRTATCEVARLAREAGENLEATARRLRYGWFAEVAQSEGIGWVATGHTANDQAETVLHRLLRGTGLQGLRGIAARRPLEPGIMLVRPLLTVVREEVMACLDLLVQDYRLDSSNASLDYTRNRLRQELLPLLSKQYNPQIVRLLSRLAQQAEEGYQLEESAAVALLAETERPSEGALRIFQRRRLLREDRHRVRSLFRALWAREGWSVARMGFQAWEKLADLVFADLPAIDLPGPIHARRRRGLIQIGPKQAFPGQLSDRTEP